MMENNKICLKIGHMGNFAGYDIYDSGSVGTLPTPRTTKLNEELKFLIAKLGLRSSVD